MNFENSNTFSVLDIRNCKIPKRVSKYLGLIFDESIPPDYLLFGYGVLDSYLDDKKCPNIVQKFILDLLEKMSKEHISHCLLPKITP